MKNYDIPYKTYLSESELPDKWINVKAFMKSQHDPFLNPATLEPCTAEDLKPVFCDDVIKQELDCTTPYIDIPEDGKLIFISWFEGGNVFRSGVTFERGYGKIFYFQPGHESYSNFYNENVLRVIGNAVRWARPVFFREMGAPCYPALEEIRSVDPAAFKAGVMQNADGSNK